MNLLTDNIKKIFFKFLIPSLGSAMVMSIYTLTDAVVIGKGVGADGLAALSIVTPLLCILMATGILFGVGGSVQMTFNRGIDKEEKSRRFFTISLLLITCICLIIWLIYLLYMDNLLVLLGGTDELFPYAKDYMNYILWFLPFAVFSNYFAIFVRADNDPNRAMAGVIAGGIVNIILDIVFVFPLHMGMGGAALATCLGMVLQIMIVASHLFSRKNGLKLIKPIKIKETMFTILSSGIPSFINELANGFIVLLFNIQILKYGGTTALAVYSVIANCMILFNSLFTGVGQSIQPIISTNYGAKKIERIKSVRKMSYITIFMLGVLFTLSGVLFPVEVCSVFLDITFEIEAIANVGIRLYFIAFLPIGINLLTSYYLQAVLKNNYSLVISILRNIALSGLAILLLPIFFGLNSLWIAIPIIEYTVLLISIVFIFKTNNGIFRI